MQSPEHSSESELVDYSSLPSLAGLGVLFTRKVNYTAVKRNESPRVNPRRP